MRCRFCGSSGHNRVGCPDAIKIGEDVKIKIANGGSAYDLDWKERFAYQIAASKEARAAAGPSATPRKCSYCSEAGHTRATCGAIKEDRAAMFGLEKRYRVAIVKYLSSINLGIGAIVQRDPEHFSNPFSILITSFNPKGFSLLSTMGNSDNFYGTYLDRKDWEGDTANIQFANINNSYENPFSSRSTYIIIAPGAPVNFPANWLDDSEIEKKLSLWFDEKSNRRERRAEANKGTFHSTRPRIWSYENNVKLFEAVV